MSALSDLIRQVEHHDPQLAQALRVEFDALARRRAFGLNFERHVPETVELPGRHVRRGDKVRLRAGGTGDDAPAGSGGLWQVTGLAGPAGERVAQLAAVGTAEPRTCSRPVTDLVVVAEFRDPIHPGLVSLERIERGGDRPFHTVIDAENLHALQALLYTHEACVDAIYIDPPYNTGNDGWIYNDKYVAADDLYKHSKWLAFMERRLILARRLLKPTGVIIVAIGDDEHHRLRMLMDQVFGADNFISNVVWQGGRKNDSRYVSNGADYMLIYANDESAMSTAEIRWREPKPGASEVLAAAAKSWRDSGGDAETATTLLREWWRGLPAGHPARADAGLRNYNRVDDARPGAVYRASDLRSPNPRPNLQYDLLHPVTGRPVAMHPNGWAYSQESMAGLLGQHRVIFGPDHTSTAAFKRYLTDAMDWVPLNTFAQDRAAGSRRLEALLGSRRFPNPKDHEVLMRWLRLVAPQDAVILDFFGGSGTTAEAVMRLNAEDGGTRRAILVTNNEVSAGDAKALRKQGHGRGDPEWEARGVFEYVARPRISTVVTGVRPDGSAYSEGLEANVEFFRMTYENPTRVAHHRAFDAIAPLLWLKAGARGSRIETATDDFAVADTYAVLFDLDATRAFLDALTESVRMAFVVTEDDRGFQMVCAGLPHHVEPVRLYSSYLTSFALNHGYLP